MTDRQMLERATADLRRIAEADQTAAPLALLQVEALRTCADPAWGRLVPELDPAPLRDALPLLHGQTVRVEPGRVQTLLLALSGVMRDRGHPGAEPLRRALRSDLDPLPMVEASIVQDADRLAALADVAGVDGALLSTLGQLATQPLLRAWGEWAAGLLKELRWEVGYCPVCAAWPTLAELRGLERQRWLRCGRCGASWWCYQHRCIFCATTDQRSQGYLAAEGERDARRASTCDACHAYLKTFTTIGPLDPVDVTIRDLTSLELDMAAIEQGYGRPERPGFPLMLTVEAEQSKSRWLTWTH